MRILRAEKILVTPAVLDSDIDVATGLQERERFAQAVKLYIRRLFGWLARREPFENAIERDQIKGFASKRQIRKRGAHDPNVRDPVLAEAPPHEFDSRQHLFHGH